jgi:hypothetical protein
LREGECRAGPNESSRRQHSSGSVTRKKLECKIQEYFAQKDEVNGRYGPLDLAAFLGVDGETFYGFLDDPKLASLVKWAITKIAGQLETGVNWDASRAVFLLKQRAIAGYSDRPDGKGNAPASIRVYFGDAQDGEVFS